MSLVGACKTDFKMMQCLKINVRETLVKEFVVSATGRPVLGKSVTTPSNEIERANSIALRN